MRVNQIMALIVGGNLARIPSKYRIATAAAGRHLMHRTIGANSTVPEVLYESGCQAPMLAAIE